MENEGLFGPKKDKEMYDPFTTKTKNQNTRVQTKYNKNSGKIKKKNGFHNLFGLIKEKEKDKVKDKNVKKKKKEVDLFGRPMY